MASEVLSDNLLVIYWHPKAADICGRLLKQIDGVVRFVGMYGEMDCKRTSVSLSDYYYFFFYFFFFLVGAFIFYGHITPCIISDPTLFTNQNVTRLRVSIFLEVMCELRSGRKVLLRSKAPSSFNYLLAGTTFSRNLCPVFPAQATEPQSLVAPVAQASPFTAAMDQAAGSPISVPHPNTKNRNIRFPSNPHWNGPRLEVIVETFS